jgi:hypothetical protein
MVDTVVTYSDGVRLKERNGRLDHGNTIRKGARYALPHSKEPFLGCDPTPGCGFTALGAGGREGRRTVSLTDHKTQSLPSGQTEGDSKNA